MSRMSELANAAADVFDDHETPFQGEFLLANDVTLDECMALAEMTALGLRLAAWALDNPRAAAAAVNQANLIKAYEAISRIGTS